MKKFFLFLVFLGLTIVLYIYRVPIFRFVYFNFIMNKQIVVEDSNQYTSNYNFSFIKNTDDFEAKNKQDLLNILYTTINQGWKDFTFYCDLSYEKCKADITNIAGDQELLSNINNYAHPFNSYKSVAIGVDSFGKITLQLTPMYTEEEINQINQKVDQIYKQIIRETDATTNKIKAAHDYIVNHAKYDKAKETYTDSKGNTLYKNKSNTAYGPLFNGLALCGGYTDLMAIFLYRMNIPNFRVSSDNHIWNAVYINNEWKHLDLTWDDPIVTTGENILSHEFFLIDTNQLKRLDNKQHNYDTNVYLELK